MSYVSQPLSVESMVAAAAKNQSRRRSRTKFEKEQLDLLETAFEKNHYPDVNTVDRLANMLNLSTDRISIWFQNRRARFKKAKKGNGETVANTPKHEPQSFDTADAALKELAAAKNVISQPMLLQQQQPMYQQYQANYYQPNPAFFQPCLSTNMQSYGKEEESTSNESSNTRSTTPVVHLPCRKEERPAIFQPYLMIDNSSQMSTATSPEEDKVNKSHELSPSSQSSRSSSPSNSSTTQRDENQNGNGSGGDNELGNQYDDSSTSSASVSSSSPSTSSFIQENSNDGGKQNEQQQLSQPPQQQFELMQQQYYYAAAQNNQNWPQYQSYYQYYPQLYNHQPYMNFNYTSVPVPVQSPQILYSNTYGNGAGYTIECYQPSQNEASTSSSSSNGGYSESE